MIKYRVVFTGLACTEEHFKGYISRLGISSNDTETILKKAPVVLKEGDSLEYIRKYADAITRAGGKVYIQPCRNKNNSENNTNSIPGMSSFTQCPQCGFRQQKSMKCERCSFILSAGAKT
jgi:hypothetical protein